MTKEQNERREAYVTLDGQRTSGDGSDSRSQQIDDGHPDNSRIHGGRTLEEIISAVAEQELSEIPPATMTPEKLAAMVAERKAAREAEYEGAHEAERNAVHELDCKADTEANRKPTREANHKAKKRKHAYKLVGGIAAVLALILIGGLVAFNALSVDVGADKNQKEEIVTEDGVVIEDGGYGAEHDGGDVWSTDDWAAVANAKTIYPQLMVPEYISAGYKFDNLTIEPTGTGDFTAEYIFVDEEGTSLEIEIFVFANGELSIDIDNVDSIVESDKGKVYIQEDNKMATIKLDDSALIKIWADISDEEIIKIANGMIT